MSLLGRPLHGLMHPEMGHMLLTRAPCDTQPSGWAFHEDCLEELAGGHAIEVRGASWHAQTLVRLAGLAVQCP